MIATGEAKRHAQRVVKRLRTDYPDARCSLNYKTPLELLVATVLSAQCTDKRVNEVTKKLFGKYPTASHYARVRRSQLERDIKSTGFFRNKAKSIQGMCQKLVDEYGADVPQKMDELVGLPGVGRKTANVVLGNAFGKGVGVVVDTHVARISGRLGLSSEKDPNKIERDLMEQIPRKEWVHFSHRMIQHGRQVCKARQPRCDECTLARWCPRIGLED